MGTFQQLVKHIQLVLSLSRMDVPNRVSHGRGCILIGCGQEDRYFMLKETARFCGDEGRGQGHTSGASCIQGVQNLEVTGQERFQINPKLKGVSMCVQEGAGVLGILPSSQVCPLQGKQSDLGRRNQSRIHCVHTHPSLKQHSDWLKGDRTQRVRTDGELLRRHMGVHVDRSAHGQTEITKTNHMEMLTRQKAKACCHILLGTKPRCLRSRAHT